MQKFIMLSPYSPFLNPIEYAFNVLQNLVAKEEWYNRGELIQTIKEKISFRGKPLNPEIPQEEKENQSEFLALTQ